MKIIVMMLVVTGLITLIAILTIIVKKYYE